MVLPFHRTPERLSPYRASSWAPLGLMGAQRSLTLIIEFCQHSMSRFPTVSCGWSRQSSHFPRLGGNSQALWSTTNPGEGKGLGLQLAEAAQRVKNQCGLGGIGKGAEWPLECPLWGTA